MATGPGNRFPSPNGLPAKESEEVRDLADYAGYVAKALERVYGRKAFRVYSVVSDTYGLNKVGNLMGQVLSAHYRTLYNASKLAAEYAERVFRVASFVHNLIDMQPQFDAVQASSDTQFMKSVKYTGLVEVAVAKTATDVVMTLPHLGLRGVRFTFAQLANVVSKDPDSMMVRICLDMANGMEATDMLLSKAINDIFDPGKQRQVMDSLENMEFMKGVGDRLLTVLPHRVIGLLE